MSERKLQTCFVNNMRAFGAVVLVKIGNFMEGRGWPDVYVLRDGLHVWFELKIDTNKLSEAQRMRMAMMERQGGLAVEMRYVNKTSMLFCECGGDTLTIREVDSAALQKREWAAEVWKWCKQR